MVLNINLSLDFCYFKDIPDKVNADDDVIVHDEYILLIIICNFFVIEI